MNGVDELATRVEVTLRPDPSRVIAQLFVPGQEMLVQTESRAGGVLGRVLALEEDVVVASLRDVRARFGARHRDFDGVLARHAAAIAHRVPESAQLSEDRRQLLGAWFTSEYAVEGAALCNPSVVAHPDQGGLEPGECRVVLSLRAVGEGHISSIGFRTGVVGPGAQLRIEDPGPHVETASVGPTMHDRALFAARLDEQGADRESASYLLARLPDSFGEHDLDAALAALSEQQVTRQGALHTAELARRLMSGSYETSFAPGSALAERVLWPQEPAESKGMEDARFVRFVDADGSVSYRATYTAFDGAHIAPQVIETLDFRSFRVSQLAGPSATNKGMALFPRLVGGRHLALSRWDRENNSLASSPDGLRWGEARLLHAPARPWELTQTGNCGSPVETPAGWLVLTHGVGPLREYAIGALLLDLEDPSRVIGGLPEPLLTPAPDERDGYVPNVVYSCGALLHGDLLLLPYGISDAAVRFAFVDVPRLLARMLEVGPPAAILANSAS